MFDTQDTNSLLLRNCLRAEQLDDVIHPVNTIVSRCTVEQLCNIYDIQSFDNTEQFIQLVARKRGKLKQVCTDLYIMYTMYSNIS